MRNYFGILLKKINGLFVEVDLVLDLKKYFTKEKYCYFVKYSFKEKIGLANHLTNYQNNFQHIFDTF